MFHLHIVGRRGHSYSISLISQWLALSIAKREDVKLTFAELPGQERQSARGIFGDVDGAILDSIPDLAAGEVPDLEVRMASHYKDPGPGHHPKLLYVFVEARGPLSWDRLPPKDDFTAATNIGLLMPSRWVRKAFIEEGVDDARLRDLGLGVSASIYAPSDHMRTLVRQQVKADGFTLLNVSGMWRTKGIEELLRATATLLVEGRNVRLILKGNDSIYPSKQALNEIMSSFPPEGAKELAKHITYIGREMTMQEMAAVYNAADVYVSPYWAEGFNMPVLEAIACGVPVVCTSGGSTDDFIAPTVARTIRSSERLTDLGTLLVPDTSDLTQQLRHVLANPAFRKSVRTAGPRHVAAGHTWDQKAAQLVEIAKEWSATVRAAR